MIAENITLAIRKTHKYVGTYADLDDWEEIGTANVLSSSSRPLEDDITEPTETKLLVEVSSSSPAVDIERALRSSFSRSGCAHEYDCCGCVSSHVTKVERQKGHQWLITINSSKNY